MTHRILQCLSGLALGATLLAPSLFLAGWLEIAAVRQILIVSAAIWFASTPFWMGRKADRSSLG